MKSIIKYAFFAIVLAVCIGACNDTDQLNPSDPVQSSTSSLRKRSPGNANPAFAFRDNYTTGNRRIPSIYVMDVTGANRTRVYSNYTNQTHQTPDFPAWSGNGSQLVFTLNDADLYTLNIVVVNGVPTGSNPTKIGDGVAAGGSYKQGKWRPSANQIACVWKKTGDPDKIHLLASTGGSPTVLYTAASTDWLIENDIAFKSDGVNLVFSERQISTGQVFLKVLDVTTSQIVKSINLSQYKSIKEMDWGKSSGSNIVAITTIPLCDNTQIGSNGIHQLHTVDVSSPAPTLTWLYNDAGNISFSPTDNRITVPAGLSRGCGNGCCVSSYSDIGIYTIATNTYSLPSYHWGNHHDWKR